MGNTSNSTSSQITPPISSAASHHKRGRSLSKSMQRSSRRVRWPESDRGPRASSSTQTLPSYKFRSFHRWVRFQAWNGPSLTRADMTHVQGRWKDQMVQLHTIESIIPLPEIVSRVEQFNALNHSSILAVVSSFTIESSNNYSVWSPP